MCGISGIFNYLNKPISSKSIIEKIVKIQHSRGPDAKGVWESKCKKVCFGHNRLSIIDLSDKGKQPFVSKDENYVITFNGEIYNFKEIKKELSTKNISFKSNTDTEVILEAYKFWGVDFVKRLRGMFAFAIWDMLNKKLVLARDPFGIKPLYYSKKNGIYYFASQVKSLQSVEHISSNFSEAGIMSYYLWGHLQNPYTLYKDIKSLNKGTCLVINDKGDEERYTYAEIKKTILNSNPLNLKNDEDKYFYLNDIVNETVKYHQVSDIPVNISLSSGIDSNVILGSLSDDDKKNCSAITMKFEDKHLKDEVGLAKDSAMMNKVRHLVGEISNSELFILLENFFKDMDLPTIDGFNNYLVAYLAKKNNSKILISGVGGDEFFSGYPSFKLIPKINRSINFFPKSNLINIFFEKIIYSFLKKVRLKTKYSSIYEFGRNVHSSFFLVRSLFLPFEIKKMVTPEVFKNGLEELNILENSKKDIDDISDERLSIMYLEIKYYLCSRLLRDADWASMSHSVELRTPFVDWFFFTKLVPLLKSNSDINKISLLNCVKNKVPQDLFTRKKTGFEIPYKNYLDQLSIKREFNNPIRDWSLLSYKKYLNH